MNSSTEGISPALLARLAKRGDRHKYDYGHALVLAGGVGHGGAARLAARAALSLGAVAAASGLISAATVRIETGAEHPPLAVSVTAVVLQDSYAVPQDFIGRLEPRQDSRLGFEIGGTLTEITVEEGDAVAESQILARLDTSLIDTELAEARAGRDALAAQLDLARLTWDRQQALAPTGRQFSMPFDSHGRGSQGERDRRVDGFCLIRPSPSEPFVKRHNEAGAGTVRRTVPPPGRCE
ncbi:efflux RND transporter periplasmic adaptor subunit [Mangrovicoccus ximenensis]|uniref:biotin/lipoyl-binding protein n=1 Tax=Mangrovicoccus ximenensis TaxID=1911570 RepID=UPI000D3CC9F4|nr:biotin/lipoyl-binding protein [Mangrovicoccus ximenensis]